MLYPRTYRALLAAGHSPAKAMDLIANAMCGDRPSLIWIKGIARMRPARVRVLADELRERANA